MSQGTRGFGIKPGKHINFSANGIAKLLKMFVDSASLAVDWIVRKVWSSKRQRNQPGFLERTGDDCSTVGMDGISRRSIA